MSESLTHKAATIEGSLPHWYQVNFPRTFELTSAQPFQDRQLVIDALSVVPYHHSLESLHLRMIGRTDDDISYSQRMTNLGNLTAFLSYSYLRNHYLPRAYQQFSILSPHEVRELTRYVHATRGELRKNEFPHPDGIVLEIDDHTARWAATCEYTAQLDLMRSGPHGYKLRQLVRNADAYAIKKLPFDEDTSPGSRRKFLKKIRSLTHHPISATEFDPNQHKSLLVIPRLDDKRRRAEVPEIAGTEVVQLPFTFNGVNELSSAVLIDVVNRPMNKCSDTKRLEEEFQIPIDELLKDLVIDRMLAFDDVVSTLRVSPIYLKTWMRRLKLKCP